MLIQFSISNTNVFELVLKSLIERGGLLSKITTEKRIEQTHTLTHWHLHWDKYIYIDDLHENKETFRFDSPKNPSLVSLYE